MLRDAAWCCVVLRGAALCCMILVLSYVYLNNIVCRVDVVLFNNVIRCDVMCSYLRRTSTHARSTPPSHHNNKKKRSIECVAMLILILMNACMYIS